MISEYSDLFSSFQWHCPESGRNVEIKHGWIENRSFPFFTIIAPVDGVYLFRSEPDKKITTVHSSETLVIPPRMLHSVACPGKCVLNYAYLFFRMHGWNDPFAKRRNKLIFYGRDAAFLRKTVASLHQCLLPGIRTENVAKTLVDASAIFSFLLEHSAELENPEPHSPHKETVEKVIQFLEQHYPEKISRSELGSITGLSETRFHYVFKEITGLPPIDYLLKIRMQNAMDLLTLTDLSVAQISDACGWNDAVFFTRQFRRKTDMTPLAYRKTQQAKMTIR